jgi:hypothetical protein
MQTTILATEVTVTIDNGLTQWKMRPDQAAKMLPTFQAGVGVASEKISAGDRSVVLDVANEFAKQVQS